MAVERISGELERITFRHDENDWSVLRVRIKDMVELQTVVGYTGAQLGQVITATGAWKGTKFGRQFEAAQIVAASPSTTAGLASYLGSGTIKGVGAKLAEQLVGHFGMDVLRVLDEAPERLREIRGIGASKAEKILMGWEAQKAVQEIMVFLHSQDITPSLCRRIYKAYGDDAIARITANPYSLCLDVRGIGFKTADAIGRRLGVPLTSAYRVQSGLVHLMQELTTAGHCGCLRPDFVTKAAEVLEVDPWRVTEVLDETLATDSLLFVEHDGAIFPSRLARAEERIADGLLKLLKRSPPYASRVNAALIQRAAERCGMKLANKQRIAVEMGLQNKVCIITGGPGCGKTATLNVLLAAFKELRLKVALTAPTGKAAQRAREATGMDAMTIHRLLGIKGATDDQDSKIHADVLVIDESSMIDVPLMAKIVAAVQRNTSVIMVGDVDQLPSVGPGQVLADIIRSECVPVTVLDEIFRQAAGSAIIANAHAINRGAVPLSAGRDGDFFVLTERNVPAIREAMSLEDETAIPAAVAQAVADEIESLVKDRLPARYGFDPIADIQVLSPMNKGGCGVHELNRRLQAALNPNPDQWTQRFGTRYGIGDKVIQVRNNYGLEIFNGDIGLVAAVNDKDETLQVRFDNRVVEIPFDDLDDLKLAYAMTIHKSQGSQAPAIVIPMVTQHWNMLQRNLLYTGVTRAAKLAVLAGQGRAIAAAVRTVSSTQRLTRLKCLLVGDGVIRKA